MALWVLLFAVVTGLGALCTAALHCVGGRSFRSLPRVFPAFWLGYVALIAILELWSLVLPIRLPAVGVLIILAVVGFGTSHRRVARLVARFRSYPKRTVSIACAILLTWLAVANCAPGDATWYDTPLYHLQMVRWNAEFPAVPGLVNLHARLGYDSSAHLFAALTDALWNGRASYIMNGFLLAVALSQWLVEIVASGNQSVRLRRAWCMLTLPFLVSKLWSSELTSLSPDIALGVLGLVACLELFSLPFESRRRIDLPLVRILGLAAVGLSTKMGGQSILVVALLVAALTVWRSDWRSRRTLILAVVPCGVLVPYFVRHVVLSGWLLFPVPIGSLHLPWSPPKDAVIEHFRWIESWARIPRLTPDQVLDHGFLHWFSPWFSRFRTSLEMAVFAVAMLVLAVRVAGGLRPSAPSRRLPEWATIAACLLGIAAWFRAAPDPRFAGFLFWALLASLAAPTVASVVAKAGSRLAPILGIGTVTALMFLVALAYAGDPAGLRRFKPAFARVPQLWNIAPAAALPTRGEPWDEGITGRIPVATDQCGDAPLPCTPEVGPKRLRTPGSLGGGFLPDRVRD